MIDPINDRLISLAEAARLLPDGGVHISTIHRWRLRGVRGVKLETCLVGGKRYTTTGAIRQFSQSITEAAMPQSSVGEFSRSRLEAVEKAEKRLAQEKL